MGSFLSFFFLLFCLPFIHSSFLPYSSFLPVLYIINRCHGYSLVLSTPLFFVSLSQLPFLVFFFFFPFFPLFSSASSPFLYSFLSSFPCSSFSLVVLSVFQCLLSTIFAPFPISCFSCLFPFSFLSSFFLNFLFEKFFCLDKSLYFCIRFRGFPRRP